MAGRADAHVGLVNGTGSSSTVSGDNAATVRIPSTSSTGYNSSASEARPVRTSHNLDVCVQRLKDDLHSVCESASALLHATQNDAAGPTSTAPPQQQQLVNEFGASLEKFDDAIDTMYELVDRAKCKLFKDGIISQGDVLVQRKRKLDGSPTDDLTQPVGARRRLHERGNILIEHTEVADHLRSLLGCSGQQGAEPVPESHHLSRASLQAALVSKFLGPQ